MKHGRWSTPGEKALCGVVFLATLTLGMIPGMHATAAVCFCVFAVRLAGSLWESRAGRQCFVTAMLLWLACYTYRQGTLWWVYCRGTVVVAHVGKKAFFAGHSSSTAGSSIYTQQAAAFEHSRQQHLHTAAQQCARRSTERKSARAMVVHRSKVVSPNCFCAMRHCWVIVLKGLKG